MKNYIYDEKAKVYKFRTKAGREIELDKEKHVLLQIDYCSKQLPMEVMCANYGFSLEELMEYKTAFKWTRGRMPLTDEEITDNSIEDNTILLLERKAKILKRAIDAEQKELREKAQKWDNFNEGTLEPFTEAVKKFQPKQAKAVRAKKANAKGRYFVSVFNDWQIGSKADKRFMNRHEDWGTDKALECLKTLMGEIEVSVQNDKAGFEKGILLFNGDLLHGLRGRTEKGTLLECDKVKDDQVDAFFEIIHYIIDRFLQIFDSVEVHTVRGNHEGHDHYPVMKAVENYYLKDKRIVFNIYGNTVADFFVGKTLFLMYHGADADLKAHIPSSGKPQESYIQSLLLNKSREYSEANSAVFLVGDKHHYEQKEYADFEYIMTGALPLGDLYADTLNLKSRARQNCFVIDGEGIREVRHFYIK